MRAPTNSWQENQEKERQGLDIDCAFEGMVFDDRILYTKDETPEEIQGATSECGLPCKARTASLSASLAPVALQNSGMVTKADLAAMMNRAGSSPTWAVAMRRTSRAARDTRERTRPRYPSTWRCSRTLRSTSQWNMQRRRMDFIHLGMAMRSRRRIMNAVLLNDVCQKGYAEDNEEVLDEFDVVYDHDEDGHIAATRPTRVHDEAPSSCIESQSMN
ncbi:uncharacterized protein B0H18DRAFT_653243 [Fomitopsis serialis]|uniref:uncharacterized protein n=1 Tax=Fomitopsis serialis TaxID=139415 RepID=UPI002008D8FD|nr:uncharacterized protein B0H18DRAFT_653243 [Neoantrodia serialis]KAH9919266.1 hypothetical protein B0H18DRAFT_653243 [Neoantrodia serialis]